MDNVLAATLRPAVGLVGINAVTASKSGSAWTLSWSGASVFFGSAVAVADQPATSLATGQIMYIDLTQPAPPYAVYKATSSAALQTDITSGKKLLLLGNNSGTLFGPFATRLEAAALVNSVAGASEFAIYSTESGLPLLELFDGWITFARALQIGAAPFADQKFVLGDGTSNAIEVTDDGIKIGGVAVTLPGYEAELPRPVTPSPFVQTGGVIERAPITTMPARNKMSCPAIAIVGSRIFIAYFGQYTSAEGAEIPGTVMVLRYSDDEGVAWSDALIVHPDPAVTNGRVSDMTLIEVGGRLFVRYMHHKGIINNTMDGIDSNWGFWVNNPLADPKFFVCTTPVYCGVGFGYNYFTIDGIPHIPRSYGPARGSPRLTELIGRWVDRFDPVTTVFTSVMQMPVGEPSGIRSYDERQIVQLRDGVSLLCIYRTTAGPYQTTYNGSTWSDPVPFTALGSIADSKSWLGRTETGRLCLVQNGAPALDGPPRSMMTVALSEDEGATWPTGKRVVIEAGPSSYPIAVCKDGKIHVTYDTTRQGVDAKIRLAVIDEADLIAGTVTPVVHDVDVYTPYAP